MGKWTLPKGEKEKNKISPEAAQKQVFSLMGYYSVDSDDIDDKASKGAFDMALNKMQKAFQSGRLELKTDTGGMEIIQHLENNQTITYGELRGENKIAMDGFDPTCTSAREYALLGSLSGLGIDAIKKLSRNDLSIAECLGFFFLMA
jgi:hypothetical protein